MAKFINTKKAVSELEDLIRNAGESLFLLSPYLKLSKDFQDLLKYRDSKNKITTVIFGKQELNPDEMKFLQGLRFINLKYSEDLHAKCYANDDKMIITSLNLHQFSMSNNKEMGVLVDKNDVADTQLFKDAMDEVDYINETSQRFDFNERKPRFVKHSSLNKHVSSKQVNGQKGFCIRTGVEIPFNLKQPLSFEAFRKWKEFGDINYPEKFCHFSGEKSNGETCFSKPILAKNWGKSQEIVGV